MSDQRVIASIAGFFNKLGGANRTSGNVFYVGSSISGVRTASDTDGRSGKDSGSPLATIDVAVGKCTANNGDTIFVLPKHVETTTAIAVDVAGIKIIGLGEGRSRPTITATTAATDLINVSAANVTLENLRLLGAASGNTALLDVAESDGVCRRMSFEQGATPVMGVTAAATSHRWLFEDCVWAPSAAGADCAIDVESSLSDDWIVRNCMFNGRGSVGWDLGVIRANADQALGWLIDNCTFIKVDTVAIDFNSSASVSDGIVRNCTILATAALTSIEDVIDVGGYHFYETFAHDGTNVTTSGARIPLGTVS